MSKGKLRNIWSCTLRYREKERKENLCDPFTILEATCSNREFKQQHPVNNFLHASCREAPELGPRRKQRRIKHYSLFQ